MSETPGRPRPRPRAAGVIVLALVALTLGAAIAGIALQKPDQDEIEITGAGATQRLISGIPQLGARLGQDSAPVTAEVFNDLQCPSCAEYHFEAIVPLIEGPVRDGGLKLVFRHFSLSPRATIEAAYAATAAGEQGRQWQFNQLLFANQEEAERRGVTEEFLERIATAVLELDQSEWAADFDSPEVEEAVDADAELAAQRRLPAEPAVVVHGPNGSRELIESPSVEEIEAAISAVS